MVDLERAASRWLERLHGEAALPSKGSLEVLRRREVAARERAEVLADAERRAACLAKELLERERDAACQRTGLLDQVQQSLCKEQRLRLDAQDALREAQQQVQILEQELEAERQSRLGAEKDVDAARHQIKELHSLLASDASIRLLEQFQQKFESQRSQIAALTRRLEVQQQSKAVTEEALQKLKSEFEAAQKSLAGERVFFRRKLQESEAGCKALREDLQKSHDSWRQLHQAGAALVTSAIEENTVESLAESLMAPASLCSNELWWSQNWMHYGYDHRACLGDVFRECPSMTPCVPGPFTQPDVTIPACESNAFPGAHVPSGDPMRASIHAAIAGVDSSDVMRGKPHHDFGSETLVAEPKTAAGSSAPNSLATSAGISTEDAQDKQHVEVSEQG